MSKEVVLIIFGLILILIFGWQSIASAISQLYVISVHSGPKIVSSAKTLCTIDDVVTDQLINTVEKNVKNDEKIRKIIDVYQKTGEITQCGIKELINVLDSEQRKRLNLSDIICDALVCTSHDKLQLLDTSSFSMQKNSFLIVVLI